jgi:hypothetical protein
MMGKTFMYNKICVYITYVFLQWYFHQNFFGHLCKIDNNINKI